MIIHQLSLSLKGVRAIPDILDSKSKLWIMIDVTAVIGIISLFCLGYVGPELVLLASVVSAGVMIVLSNQYVTLTDETENVSKASDGEYVHASGKIISSESSQQAPFTDDEGAIVAWKIEEEKDNLNRSNVSTLGRGIVSEKFEIDDDYGDIKVDLSDGEQYVITSIFDKFGDQDGVDTIEVPPGEEPPSRVKDFLNNRTDVDDVVTDGKMFDMDIQYLDGRRRYKQYIFDEGDEIYVRGKYQRDGFDKKIVDGEDGNYIIGDLKENYITDIQNFVQWSFTSMVASFTIAVSGFISLNLGVGVALLFSLVGMLSVGRWILRKI